MDKLPDYIGPCAFGIKIGIITPHCDLLGMVHLAMQQCAKDNLLHDGDVLCITESIVARAQNNFITTDDIAKELRTKYNVNAHSRIGVLFPIASRNRFSLILKGIAKAASQGEVIVQFSFPRDEVGNMIVLPEFADSGKINEILEYEKIQHACCHPITKINYPGYYKEIIETEGARAKIYFSNDPEIITTLKPDCLVVSNIHDRHKTHERLQNKLSCCLTLQDLCNDQSQPAWSEWGLLGSNMSSNNRLKLAPRNGDAFALNVQQIIHNKLGKEVEVIIYGDGAYKDPVSGIYELADPQPCLGSTAAFKKGHMREGVKYKLVVDSAYAEGKTLVEIEALLAEYKQKKFEQNETVSTGTTPRQLEDIIASLADLVSGSADAGTPLVLVKGLLKERQP